MNHPFPEPPKPKPKHEPFPLGLPWQLMPIWTAACDAVAQSTPELQLVSLRIKADLRREARIGAVKHLFGELLATLMLPANRILIVAGDKDAIAKLYQHVERINNKAAAISDTEIMDDPRNGGTGGSAR